MNLTFKYLRFTKKKREGHPNNWKINIGLVEILNREAYTNFSHHFTGPIGIAHSTALQYCFNIVEWRKDATLSFHVTSQPQVCRVSYKVTFQTKRFGTKSRNSKLTGS